MERTLVRYGEVVSVEAMPGIWRRTLPCGQRAMLLQTALETGAELGAHGRDEWMTYVVSGEPNMRVGKEAHFLGPGDRVLVPPEVRIQGPWGGMQYHVPGYLAETDPERIPVIMDWLMFITQAKYVRDALHSYYDSVRLYSNPLIDLVGSKHAEAGSALASLRQVLRDGIAALRPQSMVPFGEPEWLGYCLLWFRYIESRSVFATCEELSFSQASYYHHHREALKALSTILWEKYGRQSIDRGTVRPSPPAEPRDRAIAEAVQMARKSPRRPVDPS